MSVVRITTSGILARAWSMRRRVMVMSLGRFMVRKHGRVGVLDRHVEVGQERVVLGHDVDHAQRQRAGVDVEHAQPGEIGHTFDDLLQETG